jgi:hypothetical protein
MQYSRFPTVKGVIFSFYLLSNKNVETNFIILFVKMSRAKELFTGRSHKNAIFVIMPVGDAALGIPHVGDAALGVPELP